MRGLRATAILIFLCSICPSSSFVPSRKTDHVVATTRLFENTKSPPVFKAPTNISYGEESRLYRRTIYSHDEWRKHRSPDRFFYYIRSIVSSGVYKSLAREVRATTLVATVLLSYNAAAGGFSDFSGADHEALLPWLPLISLPLTPFTLSSPSLGLLLVFRTNTSYQRWDEARKNWGMNINHTRDLVRLGSTFYDSRGVSTEKQEADLKNLALCTWAFVRSMKRHLSPADEDEDAFCVELYSKLPKAQAKAIIDATHRPNRALQDLSRAIENLPMHFMRKNEVHKAVTIFEDNLGSSERLLTSPVPLFYSRHTARFLSFWLLLLPLALYEPFANSWNHIGLIPATALISVFLFGIEELATQLEEPFTILPMQTFCDKIYNWCNEIVSWSAGDNGMVVKAPRPEHTVAFTGTDPQVTGSKSEEKQDTGVSEQPTPKIPGAEGTVDTKQSIRSVDPEDNKPAEFIGDPKPSVQDSGQARTPLSTLSQDSRASSSTEGFLEGPFFKQPAATELPLQSDRRAETLPTDAPATVAEDVAPPVAFANEFVETPTSYSSSESSSASWIPQEPSAQDPRIGSEDASDEPTGFDRELVVGNSFTEESPVGYDDVSATDQFVPSPTSMESEIRTAIIDGAPYIDTRSDLLQPLFTESEYTTPVSSSFVSRSSAEDNQKVGPEDGRLMETDTPTDDFSVQADQQSSVEPYPDTGSTERTSDESTKETSPAFSLAEVGVSFYSGENDGDGAVEDRRELTDGVSTAVEDGIDADNVASGTAEEERSDVFLSPSVDDEIKATSAPLAVGEFPQDNFSDPPAESELVTSARDSAESPVDASEPTRANQLAEALTATETPIPTAVINGAPYIDTRSDLLQPLFTEPEYATPTSISFVGRAPITPGPAIGALEPKDANIMEEEKPVEETKPTVSVPVSATPRGLGSRGLRAVQRWKK